MRIASLLVLPLLAGLVALPTRAPAQVNVSVRFGTRLGPEIGVSDYSPERHGDWQANYRRWTPVTLYDVNGHYYRNSVRGARPVQMYSFNNEYFLPPRDQAWMHRDRRYNYRWQPGDGDYGRARPYTPEANRYDPRLGAEIGVLAYSRERAGDWRTNRRYWNRVTLYELNGRYYPRQASGTRPVELYRYRDEYFLPPADQEWVGSDKRYNYNHQPNSADRGRVRDRP
jgi:hypothetical protein